MKYISCLSQAQSPVISYYCLSFVKEEGQIQDIHRQPHLKMQLQQFLLLTPALLANAQDLTSIINGVTSVISDITSVGGDITSAYSVATNGAGSVYTVRLP